MKNKIITITVEIDGEEVTREYAINELNDWDKVVNSMLDTLEKSNEKEF